MKGYGQFCPIAKAAEILTERWTPLVLRELICGSSRFNEIHRGVPLMSTALLSQRLKRLEAEGIIERIPKATGGGSCYRLTEAGRDLEPLILGLGEWGATWARSRLERQDLDAALLMWDVQRGVRPERFPPERTVVSFRFTDGPRGKRSWWLVSEPGNVDLCLTDPGFDTDLQVTTDLRTLTAVWLGEVPVAEAISAGQLEVEGHPRLRAQFGSWLGLSRWAEVRPRSRPGQNLPIP